MCDNDPYDDEDTPGPYRDGKVHVLDDMCSTCVFRPGNLMHLNAGRLKSMVDGALEEDSTIHCHQTLEGNSSYDAEVAICRGFYDRYETTPLRMAKGLGMIEEDAQPRPVEYEDAATSSAPAR